MLHSFHSCVVSVDARRPHVKKYLALGLKHSCVFSDRVIWNQHILLVWWSPPHILSLLSTAVPGIQLQHRKNNMHMPPLRAIITHSTSTRTPKSLTPSWSRLELADFAILQVMWKQLQRTAFTPSAIPWPDCSTASSSSWSSTPSILHIYLTPNRSSWSLS